MGRWALKGYIDHFSVAVKRSFKEKWFILDFGSQGIESNMAGEALLDGHISMHTHDQRERNRSRVRPSNTKPNLNDVLPSAKLLILKVLQCSQCNDKLGPNCKIPEPREPISPFLFQTNSKWQGLKES